MLTIRMKDEHYHRWHSDEADNFTWDGPFFIVRKGDKIVGLYPLDKIAAVETRSKREVDDNGRS